MLATGCVCVCVCVGPVPGVGPAPGVGQVPGVVRIFRKEKNIYRRSLQPPRNLNPPWLNVAEALFAGREGPSSDAPGSRNGLDPDLKTGQERPGGQSSRTPRDGSTIKGENLESSKGGLTGGP